MTAMWAGVLGRTFVTKNQAPAPRTRKMPSSASGGRHPCRLTGCQAHLAGQKTADVRAAIDPGHDQDLTVPLQEALEDFARVRRRTVDLLHGWGTAEWERTITDPRGGEMSLLEVCRLVAKHEMAHVAQIRNLSALLPELQDLGPVRPAPVNGQ